MEKALPATNAERVLLLLAEKGRKNTAEIAREMGKTYIYIRNLLYDLKRRDLVDCEYVRRYVPGITWILMNEWHITDKGVKWLKKKNLL